MGKKNNDKVVGEIYETYDYEKFTFFEENRGMKLSEGYDKRRGQRLQRLINSGEYYDEIGIIKVNEKFKVVDGRHNFHVRKSNKLPIRYMFITHNDFNVDKKKDLFPPIQRINKHNSAWSVQNLFNSALNLGMPLAVTIQDLIKSYKFTFNWVEVITILQKDIGLLSAWSRHKLKPEIFEDKELIARIQSKEFQFEFGLFVKVNDKARVAQRRTNIIVAVYNSIYKSSLVSPQKLVKALENMTDDKIRAYKGVEDFTRDLIRQYNTIHGEKINPEAVLMQIRNYNKGKEVTIK